MEMSVAARTCAIFSVVLGSMFAWGRGARAPAAPAVASVAALDVRFSGCTRVERDGACVLPEPRDLYLWIEDAREGSVDVADDDGALQPTFTKSAGSGVTVRVSVPPASREVHVHARRGDGRSATRTLAIRADDAPPWLREATALRETGDLDGAEARLAPGLAADAMTRERAWATGEMARVERQRNHAGRAVTLLREALRLERDAGLVSDEGRDATVLAFVLSSRLHDNAGAEKSLDDASRAFRSYPWGELDEVYARGVIAHRTGDWRAALRSFARAAEEAERLGQGDAAVVARAAEATQLQYLGRWKEALVSLETFDRDHPDAVSCARANVLLNIGDARMLAHESGDDSDPVPPLEAALALYRGGCVDDYERALTLSNLALAHARRGDVAVALEHLADARAAVATPEADLETGLLEAEGRIALADHRFAAAIEAFAQEEQIGALAMLPVEQWRGAYGRGEALEQRGALDAAVDAYTAAERVLDHAVVGVPLGEGRDGFVADREASARALVDVLVRLGRPEAALVHARRARARVVSALAREVRVESLVGPARVRWMEALDAYRQAREELAADAGSDWRRPRATLARVRDARRERETGVTATLEAALAEATPAESPARTFPLPSDGALLLAYAPMRHGWAAFAATHAGARVVRFEMPSDDAAPDDFSRALLAPFASAVREAREVLVAPHGLLRRIDIHALPLDGAPLVARVPVRYVLDLERGAGAADPVDARAVVLSDPTGDLEAARVEGARVRDALENARAWPVHALEGLAVTPAAIAAELPHAALLHFAGHGEATGRDGWHSALPLARGATWSVGDVLALPRAPKRVVLSACEAARASGEAAEGLSLAHAFVLAGADVVLAPTREVDDELARSMAEALYASLARGGTLVTALQSAQTVVRARSPQLDWATFRALTP